MSKNKKDIKSLSVSELQASIAAERSALDKLKFSHAITPLENPMKIREIRKTIAKLKTQLNLKQKA